MSRRRSSLVVSLIPQKWRPWAAMGAIALAIWTVVAACGVILGGDSSPPTSVESGSGQPATAAFDTEARSMCSELSKASVFREVKVQANQMRAVTATLNARTHALNSSVPAIAAIVEADPTGFKNEDLQAWCDNNGL